MAHDTSYKQLFIITHVACLSGWIKVLLYTTFTILSKGGWLVALLVFRDTVHMYMGYIYCILPLMSHVQNDLWLILRIRIVTHCSIRS